MIRGEADRIWGALEKQSPRGPGTVRRRVAEESPHNIFLGVTYPAGERVIQLVVKRETPVDPDKLPTTRYIETRARLTDDHRHLELDIALKSRDMERVFTPFCEDVVASITGSSSDSEAVALLINRFEHWKRMLSSPAQRGLSLDEAQGLYAELWVLEKIVIPEMKERSLEAWIGPEYEDRDFQVGQLGIEVKSTRSDEPAMIRVTGERQLARIAVNELFLIVLKLDVSTNGQGHSLIEQVARVRALLPSISKMLLDDKLIKVGYLNTDEDLYKARKYSLRDALAFRVDEEFPCITEELLRPGVGGVEYSIAVGACEKWRCDIANVHASLSAAGSDPW